MSIDRYPLGKLLVAVRSKERKTIRSRFVDCRHPLLLDKALSQRHLYIRVDTNLLLPPGPSTCIKVQSFVERRLIILASDSISPAAFLFVSPPPFPSSLRIYYAASTSIEVQGESSGFPTEIESCQLRTRCVLTERWYLLLGNYELLFISLQYSLVLNKLSLFGEFKQILNH